MAEYGAELFQLASRPTRPVGEKGCPAAAYPLWNIECTVHVGSILGSHCFR